MATLASFESMLKEVVTAKRLSASKMNKLTEIAMNLMENDTQLVSTLYRTHKTLAPSSKIHSLYAFDALARAARSKVNKQGITGDINAEKGNCATFLLKIDGVLDGLIQDMISIGTPEAKEKTRKILDIWTKNSTFPTSVLTRLAEMAKDSPQKETVAKAPSAPPTDPRAAAHASSSPPVHITPPQATTTPDPAQAQALLQALLGSAVGSVGDANLANGSTINQIGTNFAGAGLEANQVVLLQQLVERAKAGNNNGVALPLQGVPYPPAAASPILPGPVHPQAQLAGPQPSVPYNSPPQGSYPQGSGDEYYGDPRAKQRFNRWDEPPGPNRALSPRDREHEEWHERERPAWRGGFRGGPRGGAPGRGGRPPGRREQDDWDGPSGRRRSRSRSPPRFAGGRGGAGRGGRDVRPYSPPRRPSMAPLVAKDEAEKAARPTPPGALQSGKDEFGRDIRSDSPDPTTPDTAPTPAGPSTSRQSSDPRLPSGFVPTQAAPQPPDAAGNSSVQSFPHPSGLDSINFATFDFSSPAAWEALGKAWQVTHGSLPSQEQLMQLVMGGMAQANAGGTMGPTGGGVGVGGGGGGGRGSQWGNGWEKSQTEQPGKSIPTYESGSNMSSNTWQGKGASWQGGGGGFDYEHGAAPIGADTDAVVLGGGDVPNMGGYAEPGEPDESSGGAMKRVGDRWVWQPS